jgi:DeoR family fructose operon transcriptional repressor
MGTNGLTVERGLTTPDLEESEVKRAIVAAARRVVVLTDHSKIGRNEVITFADINQVDTLVTDQASEPEILTELESQGVTVINA